MNRPEAQRHQDRRTWLVLGLIVALAAVVRVLSFRGYTTYDAAEYARLAHMMVIGDFRIGMLWFYPVFSVRFGLFAPVALAFRTIGVNEVALTAYPFLLSMLSVVVAYFAARAMFGVRAGLVAACLVALLPIDVRHASQLLPDLPAAFWMNAGVLLVYAGSRQGLLSRKVTLGALAGLALVASWICKETVLYLIPFVGLYMLWLAYKDRRNIALLLATAVVALFLAGLEGWIYHQYAGDYLFRLHALHRNTESARLAIPVFTLTGVAHYLMHRVTVVLRETLLNPYFAFMPAVALVACAYAIFRRSRRFLFPGLWFGWLLLVFSFGSGSLRAYLPLNLVATRFQFPMLLPSILLVSGLVGSLLASREPNETERSHGRRLICGVLLSVCLACVSLVMVAWGISSGMGRRCRAEREFGRVLKPTDPLYTDPHTAIALKFFWGFPAADSTHDFQGMSLSQPPPGAYVLLNRGELNMLVKNATYVPPEFRDSVPSTWQRLEDRDNATLYRVPPLLPE